MYKILIFLTKNLWQSFEIILQDVFVAKNKCLDYYLSVLCQTWQIWPVWGTQLVALKQVCYICFMKYWRNRMLLGIGITTFIWLCTFDWKEEQTTIPKSQNSEVNMPDVY